MRTNVAIVVDESGSMGHLVSPVRKMVKGVLDTLAKVQRETGHTYTINLWTFNDNARRLYAGYSPASVPRSFCYAPSGGTALYHAVIEATMALPAVHGKDANLVIVVTDGYDNVSSYHGVAQNNFKNFIRNRQADDHHTFVFHVPPGHKAGFVKLSGVPADNVNEWEATDEGTRTVEVKTSGGIEAYATARGMGQTHTEKYFTDASKITSADLYNKRATNFADYTVNKEQSAKEFAEHTTRKRYVIGQLFYQLMKAERVQENKEVVIQDKATKYIYAGPDIRRLIGIPAGKKVKVDPGNHAMYDVFIQSTSVNRILPRGTKVLLDTNRVSDLKPTWDHTAVKPKVKLTEAEKKLVGVK
jgi:hypothetical protein